MWFLIVVGVLVVALVVAMLVFKGIMKKVMAERPPFELRFGEGNSKRALLLYQPTRHDTGTNFAHQLAEGLAARGYDVTVNFAGTGLDYDLDDYELLIFGTGAYLGSGAIPVRLYLREHPFERKQVVLFSVGANLAADPEIEQMRMELKPRNIVYRIKVSRGQEEVMADFAARLELDNPDFDSIPEEDDPEELWAEGESAEEKSDADNTETENFGVKDTM